MHQQFLFCKEWSYFAELLLTSTFWNFKNRFHMLVRVKAVYLVVLQIIFRAPRLLLQPTDRCWGWCGMAGRSTSPGDEIDVLFVNRPESMPTALVYGMLWTIGRKCSNSGGTRSTRISSPHDGMHPRQWSRCVDNVSLEEFFLTMIAQLLLWFKLRRLFVHLRDQKMFARAKFDNWLWSYISCSVAFVAEIEDGSCCFCSQTWRLWCARLLESVATKKLSVHAVQHWHHKLLTDAWQSWTGYVKNRQIKHQWKGKRLYCMHHKRWDSCIVMVSDFMAHRRWHYAKQIDFVWFFCRCRVCFASLAAVSL